MNIDYVLYLDLDGVLVGFEEGYRKISKGMTFDEYADKYGKDAAIRHFQARGYNFWENLGWENGGKEVYDTAKHLYRDVRILSSTGTKELGPRHEEIAKGKRKWINRNGLEFSRIVIVHNRHLKQNYATPMSILVDDLRSNIREWNAAGGTGIYHDVRRYHHTIAELGELSKSISFSEIAKCAAHLK